MKRGRPMTPTPSASTERSRKSREKAARKARKEEILDKHIWPYFTMLRAPRPKDSNDTPWAVVSLPTLRTKGRKVDSWAELRRRRRKKKA
jgi:hypothetical protein